MTAIEYLREHHFDQAHQISHKVLLEALIEMADEVNTLKEALKGYPKVVALPVLTPEVIKARMAQASA
jgi:hypothetical protein